MASRYIVYFIQFVTTLLIAAKLGPYYMGIWGFILLLINYFSQLHFGIANSLNVLLVQHKENKAEKDSYIANSLMLVGYLTLLVLLFYLYYLIWGIPIFEKYHINKFFAWICLIGVLQYLNMIVVNVFRVRNMLNHVTLSQSIIIGINFIGALCLSEELLIDYLVSGYIIGNALIFSLALKSGCIPAWGNFNLKISTQGEILKKGFLLFLYNSCFFFIILSIKTIVSKYYSVEEFGMFAFSYSLGQAVMLLINAFSFVIFPKLIDKLSSEDNAVVKETLGTVRTGYIVTSHFVVYTALIVFPVLLWFMPKYAGTLTALNFIALTTLLDANSFGFSTLLIARNKEKTSAVISLMSLAINIILGLILARVLHVDFSFVIIATMVTYVFFCTAVMRRGSKLIGEGAWSYTLKNVFPMKLLLPYVAAVIISACHAKFLIGLPLLICIALNMGEVKQIHMIVKKLLYKPSLIDV